MANDAVFQSQQTPSGLRKLLSAGVPDEIIYSDGALWARGFRFDQPQQIHYVDRLESKGSVDTWQVTGSKGTFKVKVEKHRSDVFEQLPRRLQQGRESRNLWGSVAAHPVWGDGMAVRWAESADPPIKPDVDAWQAWADAQKHRSLKQLQDVTSSYDRMKATAAAVQEDHPGIQIPNVPRVVGDQSWSAAVQTYERQRDDWMQWVQVAQTNAALIERHTELAGDWARLVGADKSAFLQLNLTDPGSKQVSAVSSIKALELVPDLLQQLQAIKEVQGKLRGTEVNLFTGLDQFEAGDPHSVATRALGLAKSRASAASLLRELVDAIKKWHKAKAQLPTSIVTLPEWDDDPATIIAELGFSSDVRPHIKAYARLVEEAGHTKDWLPLDAIVEYQGAKFLNAPPLDLAEAVRSGKETEDAISYRGAPTQNIKVAIQLANVWPKAVQRWIVQLEDTRQGIVDMQKRWDWVADRLADAKAPKGTSGKGCWAPPSLEQYTSEPITPKSLQYAEAETEAWTNLVREYKEVHELHGQVARALDHAGVAELVDMPVPPLPEEEVDVMEALDGWRQWLVGAPSAEAIAGWVGSTQQPVELGHGISAPKPAKLVTQVSSTALRTQISQWAEGYKAWREYTASLVKQAEVWAELRDEWTALLKSLEQTPALLKDAEIATPTAEELVNEIEAVQMMVDAAKAWQSASKLRNTYQDRLEALSRIGLEVPGPPEAETSISDWDAAIRDWNDAAETIELHLKHLESLGISDEIANNAKLQGPTAKVSFNLKGVVMDPPQDQWVKSIKQWKRDETAWATLGEALAATTDVTERSAIDSLIHSLESARTPQTPSPKWEKSVQARATEAATVVRFVSAMRKLSQDVGSYPRWSPQAQPDSQSYREAVRDWVQSNALALARTSAQTRVAAALDARQGRRDAWGVSQIEWPALELPWREIIGDLSAQKNWRALSTFANGLSTALQEEAAIYALVQEADKELAVLRAPVHQLIKRVEASHAWKSALQQAEPEPDSVPADFLSSVKKVREVCQQAKDALAQLDSIEASGKKYEQSLEILEEESKLNEWYEDALNAVRDRDQNGLPKLQKKIDRVYSELLTKAAKNRDKILIQAQRHSTGIKQLFGTGLPTDIVERLAKTADAAHAALASKGSVEAYVEARLTGQALLARLWMLMDTENSQSSRKVGSSSSIDTHALRRIDAARQMLETALKERDLPLAAAGRLELQRAMSQAMFPKDIERGTMVRIGRSILNQDRATIVEEV